MSSSDSIFIPKKVDIQPTCHFMRLPMEVREMIYRPLVIARYAMVEHRINTREYDNGWSWCPIQDRPDQEYRFETAILATNRRIHEEVRDLCRRENDFICLTSRQPSCLGFDLEVLGLQMIVKGSKARSFWNISMTLTLDPPCESDWPSWSLRGYGVEWEDIPEGGLPWTYIFCSDELPQFCRLLLEVFTHRGGSLEEFMLDININSTIADGQVKKIDDHPAGRARMQKLLGPLRQLHGVGAAQIDGPLTGGYKGEIIERICRHCPTTMEIVHETMACLEQADEQACKDQLRDANLRYKAAFGLIHSCCWQHQEHYFIMSDGPFPGLEVCKVVKNIEVRLQARIAAVHYKANELRMARVYTERALGPRRSYIGQGSSYCALDIQPWEHILYAEVLYVAAMLNHTYGNIYRATQSLSQACNFAPFDEEHRSRLEIWKTRADRLTARHVEKWEARTKQFNERNQKSEAIIEVVSNWRRKGERLFRSGRSYLAASVYQTALKKLAMLDRNHNNLSFIIKAKSFQGYTAVEAIKILALRIEACLAAASLKSRNYKEVVTQTDAALKCDDERYIRIHRCGRRCSHSYENSNGEWVEHQNLDYLRLHYCRAMALHHLGDTVTAKNHMEEALSLDPGDNNVFEKLTMLKQELAEKAARKVKLEKLNSSQNQLRKKQARRRRAKT